MAVIGYVRVSTQEQTEGVSLDAQRQKIKSYCGLHQLELKRIIADEGLSAKNMRGRPSAQELLALIERRAVDGLVMYKLDRLFRNTKDAITVAELCQKKGVALHSISEKINTETAFGEFFFTLMAALAQLERKQVSERTLGSLQYKRLKGEMSLPPFVGQNSTGNKVPGGPG